MSTNFTGTRTTKVIAFMAKAEADKKRYGCYPEVVIADTVYGSRDNTDVIVFLFLRMNVTFYPC
jgi:hypothetical protein